MIFSFISIWGRALLISTLAVIAIPPVPGRAGEDVLKPGSPKPAGAVVLFDGSDLSLWTSRGSDKPSTFKLEDGAMVAADLDTDTKEKYRAFQLHLEWMEPQSPADLQGEARGNSGVYVQCRYEIQILDSYGTDKPGKGDCGAVYRQTPPLKNACKKPGEWQTYDITFHPARFKEGKKVMNARVTVYQNGELVQDNTEITGSTGRGDKEEDTARPLRLQYHHAPVKFRNIWIVPLEEQ